MTASVSTDPPDLTMAWKRFAGLPPGSRAELRRVAEPDDLSLVPALYRLFPGQRPDARYLRVAFLMPWCTHATNARSFGSQLANAAVADARVLQVARSQSPLDLIQLRRLAAHIEPTVNWSDFGRALWYWGELSKRRLVEDFYLARFDASKGGK